MIRKGNKRTAVRVLKADTSQDRAITIFNRNQSEALECDSLWLWPLLSEHNSKTGRGKSWMLSSGGPSSQTICESVRRKANHRLSHALSGDAVASVARKHSCASASDTRTVHQCCCRGGKRTWSAAETLAGALTERRQQPTYLDERAIGCQSTDVLFLTREFRNGFFNSAEQVLGTQDSRPLCQGNQECCDSSLAFSKGLVFVFMP